MVIDAFISMFMLGARINCAKYCCKIVSSLSHYKNNMLMEFLCGFFVLMMSVIDIIRVPVSLYFESTTLR